MRLWFYCSLLALFVLLALTYLMRPIMEPDFFWHLKTGEWIWQQKALPAGDPFSFTGPQTPDSRQLVILQGYWLMQLTYHAFVAAFGLWGIFLLRLFFLATFFVLFVTVFERHRVNRTLAFSLLAVFCIFFLENYALERPQVITFLAVGLQVILYRQVRDGPTDKRAYAFSLLSVFLLMSAWSNMHGGILLGQGVLAVMGIVEVGTFWQGRDRQRFVKMMILVLVAGAGSLLAPAQIGVTEVLSLIGVGEQSFAASQSLTNYEFFSVYTWLIKKNNYKLLIPVALSLASLLALKGAIRKKNHLEAILLVLFWVFAYRHVRYLPIAMTFSLLFVSWFYRPGCWMQVLTWPLLIGVVCSLFLWTSNEFKYLPAAVKVGLVSPLKMPVGSAQFLLDQEFRGRIFNTYNWGGYLLWRLAPDLKVATDSRLLDEAVYLEMRKAQTVQAGNKWRPYWKQVTDKYDINIAIVPTMNGRKPSTLYTSLARDYEWSPVFQDQVSAVFLRNPSRLK